MKSLIGTLLIVLGCYFASYSFRLIVLRNAGPTSLFKVLNVVTGYLPYLSIGILLVVGIASVLKSPRMQFRALAMKLACSLIVAVVPIGIHIAMFSFTYSGAAAPQTELGPLSPAEWMILILGIFLIVAGSLFLRLRSAVAAS